MSRVRRAAAIGVVTGVVGLVLNSFVAPFDDTIGLPLLFLTRGRIPPPPAVVVVSIDEAAATRMGMPISVRDWPRSTHAVLIDRLVQRGAAAIAFDIQFLRHGDGAADRAFAEAIGRARRVVLAQRVELSRTGNIASWERQNPIPELAGRAVGVAPVPLPDVARVSWGWSFLETADGVEVPTLPAVALQLMALPVTAEFLDVLAESGVENLESLPRSISDIRGPDDLPRSMQLLRQRVRARGAQIQRHLAPRLSGEQIDRGRLLSALVDLYSGAGVRHLNFYGPPGTICTVPYDVALSEESRSPCRLEGAVVFVGLGPARVERSGLPDTYHAAYPTSDGVDFSGVEIHATTFANLLTGTSLRRLDPVALIAALLAAGNVLGSTVYWVRTRRRWTKGAVRCRMQAAGVGTAVAAAYVVLVYVAFRSNVALPLVVPVVVQLPVALVMGLLAPPARHREQLRAVCLATDAGGSTAVGQHLAHAPYAQLMDEYRQMLVRTVHAHGGEPVPPEGDGLVCLWRCPAGDGDREVRLQACRAALAIADAAQGFNARLPGDRQLPTRIGLTLGTVTVSSDADRGVYEVFGDTINLAARLRDANRDLDTQVIGSSEVVSGLDDTLPLRLVADAIPLRGVTASLAVFEMKEAVRNAAPTVPARGH